MTATTLGSAPPSSGGGSTRNRVLVVLLVVAGVAVGLLALWAVSRIGGGSEADTTVDRSRDPNGMAALVLLLEHFGATVEPATVARLHDRSLEPVDVVLVLPGVELGTGERLQLSSWAMAGGRVVDATGGTVAGRARPSGSTRPVRLGGPCDLTFLRDVEHVRVQGSEALLDATFGQTACLRPDGSPDGVGFLVSQREGAGTRVDLGGATPFTNALLDAEDNAVLATSLLAPAPGTSVVLLTGTEGLPRTGSGTRGHGAGSGAGSGGTSEDQDREGSDAPEIEREREETLLDHVPEGIRWGLVQLLVALVLYVLWRGRRVGQPVAEPAPVDIDGSQLVAAVGTLLARTGSHRRAGELLREDTARLLARRLGLPASTPHGELAAAAAARFGIDEMSCRSLLDGPPVTDDERLLALAAQLDDLREEIRDGVPA